MDAWSDPKIIAWTQILLNSYQRLLGRELLAGLTSPPEPQEQAKLLFRAPFVVVSHGTQADPILNYGNQIALDLWEMTWAELTQTPSRLTAEPENRDNRHQMLLRVKTQGFIDDYQGVRISLHGRRFKIDRAIVWNLWDADNNPCGQAATFGQWRYLPAHQLTD